MRNERDVALDEYFLGRLLVCGRSCGFLLCLGCGLGVFDTGLGVGGVCQEIEVQASKVLLDLTADESGDVRRREVVIKFGSNLGPGCKRPAEGAVFEGLCASTEGLCFRGFYQHCRLVDNLVESTE